MKYENLVPEYQYLYRESFAAVKFLIQDTWTEKKRSRFSGYLPRHMVEKLSRLVSVGFGHPTIATGLLVEWEGNSGLNRLDIVIHTDDVQWIGGEFKIRTTCLWTVEAEATSQAA